MNETELGWKIVSWSMLERGERRGRGREKEKEKKRKNREINGVITVRKMVQHRQTRGYCRVETKSRHSEMYTSRFGEVNAIHRQGEMLY